MAALTLAIALPASARAEDPEVTIEPFVIVTHPLLGATGPDEADLATRRATTGDSASLLRDLPGLSLSGAGGISSLPAIHGLSDDRLRIQVDGADLMPACPNHMNSPLSYADPAKVAEVVVYDGITPVSAGGDSIGGSIQVRSAPPEFGSPGEALVAKGRIGSFWRSNGDGHGYNLGGTLAGPWLSLTYGESSSQSDDFTAGRSFKPVAPGREGGGAIPGDVVGSSAYSGAANRSLGLALRLQGHTLQLEQSRQTVDFEGFPNQRMDMTSNDNRLLNVHYAGQFTWGDLEARFTYQSTRHTMDMGPDRYLYGTGMPMDTRAKTRGALLKGSFALSERDTLRAGLEWQYYTLFDWWPPVGGSMGPNAFWNVDFGERRKIDAFAEWEARWSERWVSQVGLRSDNVWTNAGPVQGYDNGLAGTWGDDAAAFNAKGRVRSDHNWDLTALGRYTPSPTQSYEGGYARKSRSPNLYQRYPWATNAMAALMNNFVGDGNGYVGNVDLAPEVAQTVSLSGVWHDDGQGRWRLKATGHYTHVHDYIDARRCALGQCNAASASAPTGFLTLQYVNQAARLYGLDLSGRLLLVEASGFGSLTASSTLNYVRGDNLTTGDHLYGLMPPNLNVGLAHRLGVWTTSAEALVVGPKDRVSRVRNEVETPAYLLLNLHSSLEWKHLRLDVDVENLFDRFYANPLGGAYVGQGPSMTSNGIAWGVLVPGKGRSFNVALNLFF